MLQRLGIRGKLLAVVAVPTIVLVLAASFVVFNSATSYTAGRNTSQLVEVVESGTPLVAAVQAERAEAAKYLRAINDGEADRLEARSNVDNTVAALKKAGEEDPAFAPIAKKVQAAINGVDAQSSLDVAREIADVPAVEGDFPAWPTSSEVRAKTTVYTRIAQNVADAVDAAPVNDLGTLARSLPGLIRYEATTTQNYLDDARTSAEAMPGVVEAVNRTKAPFLADTASIARSSTNEAVLGNVDNAAQGLAALDDMRSQIRAGTSQPGQVDAAYTDIVSELLNATREVSSVTDDSALSSYLDGFVAMGELLEAMRHEQVYLTRKIAQGTWRLGETVQFQEYYFRTNNALENAMNAVAPLEGITEVPPFGASYSATETSGFETIRDRLISDTTSRALLDQRTADWEGQVDEEIAVQAPILYELQDAVNSRAATVERDSLIQMIATIAIAVLAVVASLLVAQAIARRIINPLRRLTTTATAVRQELPRLVERVALPGQSVDVSEVQIPVESQDEVGRLAEAFNSVNAATLSIASEQAALRGSISEMFVNVARRDQVLLNRQLSSIDEMERTEDNQTTLTKLFALDHLATRMRRNSESLLVLAGIDTGRRLRRSMPLSDVIRTASSEIEMYERVQLELDADPSMLGHSALTAAHLFAELLENATVFSDPGTPVVVKTMNDGDNVVVEVLDYGIGMTPEETAEANARVASTAASEILGAQRLGLFVVGRIARRIGARVQLESIQDGGIRARVVMPPSLFDASATYEQGHHSSSATDEVTHAPSALVQHSVADSEVRDAPATPESSPPAQVPSYQPTVIHEGSGLAGRAVESSAPADHSEDQGIDGLVAADAASAPESVPVDLDSLTEGATPVGLPTRRRKSDAATPEAPQETNSIIGVPMRASDEQLTALQSAATSGFTPILAADEVSPESAEQRARVFRGFRPLRADGTEGADLPPDAESLGHAVRRGAPVSDMIGQAPESGAVPALEPDAAQPEPEAPTPEESPAPETASPFAVEAADPRHTETPVMRQSPLIATGFTDADPASTDVPGFGRDATPPMAIPMLEEDEDEPVHDAGRDEPTQVPSAGVDSVALDDGPFVEQRPAPEHHAAAPQQASSAEPVYRSPLYPTAPSAEAPYAAPGVGGQDAPSGEWSQAPAGNVPQFESDPVTSTPSLDDLIMDGARPQDSDERGGFFSRMFGRGRKQGPQPEAPSAAPMPEQQPRDFVFGEPSGPSYPAPSSPPSGEFMVPAEEPHPAPTEDRSTWIGGVPADDFSVPEQSGPRYEPPFQSGPPSGTHDVVQERPPEPWTPTAGTERTPPEQPGAFSPQPASHDDIEAEWSYAGGPAAPQQTEPAAPMDQAATTFYSPDQLARPLGWEAAGESALEAAAPEASTEYRPVVQLEEQESDSSSADVTSEVFSELSSLATERPKVEKTRAGLVKRTPVEREVEPPPSANVAAPDVPRDAEAVRNRFSSFYSGTQRARDDVKNFNDSTQGSLTES